MAQQAWNGQTGGTHWMQRALVWMIQHWGLSFVYGIMHFWLIWYILVRPSVRNGTYYYHRRHRGRNWFQACLDVYHSFYQFGKEMLDRFAVYSGYEFDIVVDNKERFYNKVKQKEGFVLMFSHVGNSEMAAYTMATPDKRMHVLAFGGETPVVMEQRARVLKKNNIGMIVVNSDDMSYIFEIGDVISRGEVLAVAGDRRWGDKTIPCDVLGAKAPLPAGIFQLCATLKCPIVLPFVFKEPNNRYHIYTEELHVNPSLPRAERAADLAQQFADQLTAMAKAHPYEWFNFFDFWDEAHK